MKIPRIGSQTQIAEKPLEPTQSPQAAGAPYRAIGEVIGKATDFATTLMEKRYQAEAVAQSHSASMSYSKFVNDLSSEMDLKYAGQDPAEMTNEFNSRASKYKEQVVSEVTNNRAREKVALDLDGMYSNALQDVDNKKNKYAAHYYLKKETEFQDEVFKTASSGNFLRTQDSALMNMKHIQESVANGLYSQLDADKAMENLKKVPDVLLKSVIASDSIEGLGVAKALAEGKADKLKPLYNMMGAEDIIRYKAAITSAEKEMEARKTRALTGQVDNFVSALKNGQEFSAQETTYLKTQVLSLSDATNKTKLYSELDKAEAAEVIVKTALANPQVPHDEIIREASKTIASKYPDKYQKQAIEGELNATLSARLTKMDNDFANDPAEFVYKSSPVVRTAASKLLIGEGFSSSEDWDNYKVAVDTEYARLKGVPNARSPSYASPVIASKVSGIKNLIQAKDFATAAEEITKIENSAGPDTEKLLLDSKIEPQYAVLSIATAGVNRKKAVELIKNKASIKSQPDLKFKDTEKELANSEEYKAFMNGTSRGESVARADAVLELVALNKVMGSEDPWSIVMEGKELVASGNGDATIVPKQDIDDKDALEEYMQYLTVDADEEVIKMLNLPYKEGQNQATLSELQALSFFTYDQHAKRYYLMRTDGTAVGDANGVAVSISKPRMQTAIAAYLNKKRVTREQRASEASSFLSGASTIGSM
jgi:hypothetical protein